MKTPAELAREFLDIMVSWRLDDLEAMAFGHNGGHRGEVPDFVQAAVVRCPQVENGPGGGSREDSDHLIVGVGRHDGNQVVGPDGTGPVHLEAIAGFDRILGCEHLHRRSGGVLEVAVMERVPVAVRRSRRGLELVDATGQRVRQIAHRSARADLPLIAGEGSEKHVPEALALMAAAAPIADRIRGLLRVGERRWDVVLDRDQRILLPEKQPVTALERVILLNQSRDVLARDIRTVDLRDPERLTLRLSDAALAQLRQTQSTGGVQ